MNELKKNVLSKYPTKNKIYFFNSHLPSSYFSAALKCAYGQHKSFLSKLRHYEKATKFEKKSPTCFHYTAGFTQLRQNKWEIFSNFCDLLRKAEL